MKMIYGLIPDSYTEYQPVWEPFGKIDFTISEAVVLEPSWKQELEEIQEAKATEERLLQQVLLGNQSKLMPHQGI